MTGGCRAAGAVECRAARPRLRMSGETSGAEALRPFSFRELQCHSLPIDVTSVFGVSNLHGTFRTRVAACGSNDEVALLFESARVRAGERNASLLRAAVDRELDVGVGYDGASCVQYSDSH